ncbi:hypothetical protein TCAL_11282 [Tigriopus californicus]|uniref:TLC domain-containing protein n=1 Tax=Tigriopus californicus TaxID=6832 RepID=A0A553NUF9_TIGCA|nr:TLC domain-containing protein 3A-like [Tigriopus californicus]TRY69067.1 hypothetical protein TCAL_11282 [Tigriopus californicus]|eukprot:TCALIF_11282-PA protein Name:"Similar to FAM57A Protein FAM57A (Homo sapiens)" AED:0.01 eAED:0.01 QI:0/-1/0/1/-1/1/1/0/290
MRTESAFQIPLVKDAKMQTSMYMAGLEVATVFLLFLGIFNTLKSVYGRPSFVGHFHLKQSVVTDIANKTMSALFAVTAASTGIFLMTASDRRKQDLLIMEHILFVVMAYFFYDTISMFKVFEAKYEENHPDHTASSLGLFWRFMKDQPLLIAHHLSLAAIFCPMMSQCLDHEPGDLMVGCALIFEASTPFVSLRAILSHLGLKSSLLYLFNGLAMVIVFPMCRIFIYGWFYYTYASIRNITIWEGVASTPRHCMVFMTLVLLPQLYWYRLMVKGASKVLEERRGKAEKRM